MRAAGRTVGVKVPGQIKKANKHSDDTTWLEQTGNSSIIQIPGEGDRDVGEGELRGRWM